MFAKNLKSQTGLACGELKTFFCINETTQRISSLSLKLTARGLPGYSRFPSEKNFSGVGKINRSFFLSSFPVKHKFASQIFI